MNKELDLSDSASRDYGTDSKRLTWEGQVVLGFFRAVEWAAGTPPVEVVGLEKVPPPPHIIAANHRGLLEGPAIFENWPYWPYFMTKYENFKNPVAAKLWSMAGMFPVRRGEVDREALKQSLQVLKDDKVLAMFYEGTRHGGGSDPEQLKAAKTGTAWLAIIAKVPIVPVAFVGTEKVLPLLGENKLWIPFDLLGYHFEPEKPRVMMLIGEPICDHLDTGRMNKDELTDILVERERVLIDNAEQMVRPGALFDQVPKEV